MVSSWFRHGFALRQLSRRAPLVFFLVALLCLLYLRPIVPTLSSGTPLSRCAQVQNSPSAYDAEWSRSPCPRGVSFHTPQGPQGRKLENEFQMLQHKAIPLLQISTWGCTAEMWTCLSMSNPHFFTNHFQIADVGLSPSLCMLLERVQTNTSKC